MSLLDFQNSHAVTLYGMTKNEAHAKGVCISCKKTPVFTSKLGPKEYQISGLCDPCWDAMFDGGEPNES